MSLVRLRTSSAGRVPTGHPAGGQGPVRHRRARDDLRLGRVRRARARADRGGGAAARGRRLRERRQDEPARVRLRHDLREPALRRRPQPALPRPGRGRLERRLGGGARGRARRRGARHRLGRLDPDPRRLLRRRRPQADPRARVARGLLAARGELRHGGAARPRRGGMRADAPRARSRPTSRSSSSRSRSSRSASPGRKRPTRSCGRGSRRRAARFPRRRAIELPLVDNATYAVFMREAADVHRELFAENGGAYGEDVQAQGREVPRGAGLRGRARRAAAGRVPGAGGGRARRARPRADADAADRRAAAAPRRRRRSRRPRAADPLHVSLLGARLAGAGAPVRPRRGRPAGLAPDRGTRGRRRARPRRRPAAGAKPG